MRKINQFSPGLGTGRFLSKPPRVWGGRCLAAAAHLAHLQSWITLRSDTPRSTKPGPLFNLKRHDFVMFMK